MKKFQTICLVCLLELTCLAQPFRYKNGNDSDRDTISSLKISGYKEFIQYQDSSKKILVTIEEFDKNGNVTRHLIIDPVTGNQNQWTYQYSHENLLLEQGVYYPDSTTLIQHFIHEYDYSGNEIKYVNEFYSNGKFAASHIVVRKYDAQNRCIDALQTNHKGEFHSHYGYEYGDGGLKTELVYNEKGDVLWRREGYINDENELDPIGFPPDEDPETKAYLDSMKQERIAYFADSAGGYQVEDGYDIRRYNQQGMLIYWYEKKYREHWFEYSYHKD